MDRHRLGAGRLAQPLGRPAGRRGEQELLTALLKRNDDRASTHGFACARATCQHAHFIGQGHLHGLALERRQVDPAPVGQMVEDARPVRRVEERRDRRGRAQQVVDALGHAALRAVERQQVDQPLTLPGLDVDLAGDRDRLECRGHARRVDLQQLGPTLDQFVPGQVAVPVLGGLAERVAQPRADALRRVVRDAKRLRDPVGRQEADPIDLVGQAVGRRLHDAERLLAVLLVDPHREAGCDLQVLQEQHDRLDLLLLLPGAHDPLDPLGAEAGHLAQA